jgi:hypothetical protein
MSCRFYGKHSALGALVDSHGNQCALITEAFSPCRIETNGLRPDETSCALALASRPHALRECRHRRGDDVVIEVLTPTGELCGTIRPTPQGIRIRGVGFTLQFEAPDGSDGPAITLPDAEPPAEVL